ncbi:MAG: SAM-dependent methyltransferase [Treponema sp.]|jgi:hypothetical protein|nr:SAM-dependent methyltransferase [Treponema sp.]
MDIKTLNSSVSVLPPPYEAGIGVVYTPLKWAIFAIETYNIFDLWMAGKTIFDPTMGCGNLLAALVEYGLSNGYTIPQLPINNLFGLEIEKSAYQKALDLFKTRYKTDQTHNFYNDDIFNYNEKKFDALFGNPPWCNFVDLPSDYKEKIKSLFFTYNLIDKTQKLLLGGSRIDMAALVVQKTILCNLRQNGDAVFFLPLSLFLNNGAHAAFRKFSVKNIRYSLRSVYDFDEIDVFEKISTRYGLASFKKEYSDQIRFVPYFRNENNKWIEYEAAPSGAGGAYIITKNKQNKSINIPSIYAPKNAKPRQGVNPCGAIDVFVFKEYTDIDSDICKVNGMHCLPKKYVYPLITANNFCENKNASKWVLLPYNRITGKPLAPYEVENEPYLFAYLQMHKKILERRKGVLIQAHIKRGLWWSLLGVGPYSFSLCKIVWEAYGKKTFKPLIFDGNWQANQSLQAFIPCEDRRTAEGLLLQLSNPQIEEYLLASRMEGTMNWAQPGKVSSILHYQDKQSDLFA